MESGRFYLPELGNGSVEFPAKGLLCDFLLSIASNDSASAIRLAGYSNLKLSES
jgi:hypothetical protein